MKLMKKLVTRDPESADEGQGDMMERLRSLSPNKLKDDKETLIVSVLSALLADENGFLEHRLNETEQVEILAGTLSPHVFTARDIRSIITSLRKQGLPSAKDFTAFPYTIAIKCLIAIWIRLGPKEIDQRYGKGASASCH